MRDHTKLKAFHLADELALLVYKATRTFPKNEQYGLTSQMRRAAVSIPSNTVEGCARRTQADYLHFLDMAYGSLREIEYQLSLVRRLGYLPNDSFERTHAKCVETSQVLAAFIRALRKS